MGKSSMKRIYITSHGELKRKSNTLAFVTKEGTKYVPVTQVRSLYVYGEVRLNKRVLHFISRYGIPIHFFSRRYLGSFLPKVQNVSGFVLLKQVQAYLGEDRVKLAKAFVEGSIKNMALVLRENGEDPGRVRALLERLEKAGNVVEVMGVEGAARVEYYQALDGILGGELGKRTKRPPENWLNSLISLGNTMLYLEALDQIIQTQLDPRIGFLHSTNLRRFSLNLDIADVFKPLIVDRLIISMVNRREVGKDDFEVEGLKLKKDALRKFLVKFDEKLESKVKVGRRRISYSTLLRYEAYKVERHVIGDGEYRPHVGR
ncbi:CRISPR-associated endonuclease Cas1 [Sulfodiicoccus acidiphilus]|uniref:CRISPR-associated endonuclease Cas1 n=1 Tax=Sulfodiicoccus acidiphilus TaxID=1670455 RepID=A0A348B5A3_9CREN|nr:type I-B CRISPR-associated endonuclease Cas1b [Sulfodiicoccus acidiphilus]BBD73355.1 CRISPR-associated endonuclease Cas1 [Sulfodiicoccus acidiphilus]GGT88880.1 CRISPR-associated endonuclease Cas1 [Sulfodiicoccus acidiphilus]